MIDKKTRITLRSIASTIKSTVWIGKEGVTSNLLKQLEEELDGYRQKELKKQKRKNLIKNILLFLWSFLWKSSIVVALIFSGIWIDNNTEMDILKYVILAVDIIGVITVFISVLGKDIRKYFLGNK